MLNRREGLKAALGGLALGGLALSGRAQAADRQAVVSLSEQRSRFFIDVAINDRTSLRFVLDTGATTHFVSTRLIEEMGLPQVAQRTVRAFDGARRDAVVNVAALNVGGVALGPTRMIGWGPDRLEGHDGLIGYPFLLPSAVMNLSLGQVSLGAVTPDALAPVKARVLPNQAILMGGLEGAEGRFVLDTGAQNCTVSPAYAARIQATEAYQAADKLIYRGADGQQRTSAIRPREIAFGDFRIRDPIVRMGQADGREGVFHDIDGLFGINLIRPYTWALDQRAGTLRAGGEAPARTSWYGAGLQLAAGGVVSGIVEDGPAFEAGLRPGQRLISLDGEPPERMAAVATPRDRPVRRWAEVLDRDGSRTVSFDTRELL